MTESSGSVSVSMGVTVPALVVALYALLWQTYVLKLEVSEAARISSSSRLINF